MRNMTDLLIFMIHHPPTNVAGSHQLLRGIEKISREPRALCPVYGRAGVVNRKVTADERSALPLAR
jgi:hypothetical protein